MEAFKTKMFEPTLLQKSDNIPFLKKKRPKKLLFVEREIDH